jgi:hypothetical protein
MWSKDRAGHRVLRGLPVGPPDYTLGVPALRFTYAYTHYLWSLP